MTLSSSPLAISLPGLEHLTSIPPTSRVLLLDQIDGDLLSLFPWKLLSTMSHHRLASREITSLSHLSARASLGGFVFYPHHLVIHSLRETPTTLFALLTSLRYGDLYDVLSLTRHSRITFLNRSRLDVRRANLRLEGDPLPLLSPSFTPPEIPQHNTGVLPNHSPIMDEPLSDTTASLPPSEDSLDLSKIFGLPPSSKETTK